MQGAGGGWGAASRWGLGPAPGGRGENRGEKGKLQPRASPPLLSSAFPALPAPLPGPTGEDGGPGAPVSLSWRAPRASLTCKLASSDWLWQQRAATLPAPRVCVCVCVCARASSLAGLGKEGAALVTLDSTDSSIHGSHTHRHTHTHTYTKTHSHTHPCYTHADTRATHPAYMCTPPTDPPGPSQPATCPQLRDTSGHTVAHTRLPPQRSQPPPPQTGICQAPPPSKHTILHPYTQPPTEANPQMHCPRHSHRHTQTHRHRHRHTHTHTHTHTCSASGDPTRESHQVILRHTVRWEAGPEVPHCALGHGHHPQILPSSLSPGLASRLGFLYCWPLCSDPHPEPPSPSPPVPPACLHPPW